MARTSLPVSHGSLSAQQEAVVSRFIGGKVVLDLGAGNLALASRLASLGARRVWAIDYRPMRETFGVSIEQASFKDDNVQRAPADVAFISWAPSRVSEGLRSRLSNTPVVIYLGKNTDGYKTGTPGMFHDLGFREVLAYVPEKRNTLIVYGRHLPYVERTLSSFGYQMERKPLGEEFAGLNNDRVAIPYEAAEAPDAVASFMPKFSMARKFVKTSAGVMRTGR